MAAVFLKMLLKYFIGYIAEQILRITFTDRVVCYYGARVCQGYVISSVSKKAFELLVGYFGHCPGRYARDNGFFIMIANKHPCAKGHQAGHNSRCAIAHNAPAE